MINNSYQNIQHSHKELNSLIINIKNIITIKYTPKVIFMNLRIITLMVPKVTRDGPSLLASRLSRIYVSPCLPFLMDNVTFGNLGGQKVIRPEVFMLTRLSALLCNSQDHQLIFHPSPKGFGNAPTDLQHHKILHHLPHSSTCFVRTPTLQAIMKAWCFLIGRYFMVHMFL